MQRQLAETNAVRGVSADAVPLSDVEPRRLDVVLTHWREAQLRLGIAEPGSREAQTAADDVERLRDEYQAGFQAKV